jgi:hypothetical protein
MQVGRFVRGVGSLLTISVIAFAFGCGLGGEPAGGGAGKGAGKATKEEMKAARKTEALERKAAIAAEKGAGGFMKKKGGRP